MLKKKTMDNIELTNVSKDEEDIRNMDSQVLI